MKAILLSLIMIVSVMGNAQRGTIGKYTGTYYYFTFPEDKEDSFYAAIPSSDRFVTIRGDTVLNCYKFEIVLGQMGRVAYCKCGSRDTIISNPNALIRLLFGSYRDSRKMIDSLEQLLRPTPTSDGSLSPVIGDIIIDTSFTVSTTTSNTQQMQRFDKIKKVWVDVPRRNSPSKIIAKRQENSFDYWGQKYINAWDKTHSFIKVWNVDSALKYAKMYTRYLDSTMKYLDSNGTYHDHMPTQLTVKKRHKRHKWVKKSPPTTKD